MRVLVVTNLYPNPLQPHRATFNRQQFAALASGHQVQVIAPIAWTSEWGGVGRGPGARLDGQRCRTADGMVIHHPRYLFTPRVLRGTYGHFYARSIRARFDEAVSGFRPDVVLASWAYPDGWAALRLARRAGLPIAIKVHGSDVLTLDGQAARRRRTIESLRAADAVVAVSGHLRDRTIEMGVSPARVRVVYNGVDMSAFHPGSRDAARGRLGITSREPLVLFVGNLVPVKGLDVLLDAMAALAREGASIRCAIIGDGPLAGELRARIGALGLDASVRMVGALPLRQLPDWYRAADVLALPSRSEGLPNVLLEATACGTPCVASRVGGIPEIIPAEGLVPPEDAMELARRIREVIRNRGWTAPARASSWADSAGALAAVLQSIVPGTNERLPLAA